ncbi:MAG: recombinase, partial [Bacteroidaceae bacterium]|nr:recombinase [Bacteroidaceae bacterium]
YISDSMGHSGNGDITSNYIGAYPLAKMLEYNHYLLNSEVPAAQKPDSKSLIEMLKGLSEEEKQSIIAALSE